MSNVFDPYREALVVEQHTIWPDAYEDWSTTDRQRIESLLHASPAEVARALGLSPNAAHQLLHRAKQSLKAALSTGQTT